MHTFEFLPFDAARARMIVNAVLGMLVLTAISFALLYSPALSRVVSFASPYPKADVMRRLFAGILDGSLFVTSLYFYQNTGSVWFVVAGAVYLVFRDAVQGRSVGKFSVGLAVISLETGRPCRLAGSFRRNLMFLFPGVNIVAVVLESVTVVRDPQGHRLGDKLAQTQVVVGIGAQDLAQSFLQWFVDNRPIGSMLPDRQPGQTARPSGEAPRPVRI